MREISANIKAKLQRITTPGVPNSSPTFHEFSMWHRRWNYWRLAVNHLAHLGFQRTAKLTQLALDLLRDILDMCLWALTLGMGLALLCQRLDVRVILVSRSKANTFKKCISTVLPRKVNMLICKDNLHSQGSREVSSGSLRQVIREKKDMECFEVIATTTRNKPQQSFGVSSFRLKLL